MTPAAAQLEPLDPASVTAPAEPVRVYLSAFLDERPLPKNLDHAVRYGLLGAGKMLRPILVVRSCEAVGGRLEQALPAAGAIELIHAFSLVHDDLPAMDDDDLRRGRPTLHKYMNEAMAILAGDVMMGLAFELVTTRLSPAALAQKVAGELSIGTNNMIAGQVYDTLPDFDESVPAMARLETIHRNKTGALLRCSCRMGAICGGANEQQLAALTDYADAIGLMFQIVDDLLDVTQTTEALGKAAGKDADKGKLTYPGLLGIEKSRSEVQRLRDQAHAALDRLVSASGDQASNERVAHLRRLCDYLSVRQK